MSTITYRIAGNFRSCKFKNNEIDSSLRFYMVTALPAKNSHYIVLSAMNNVFSIVF